MKFLFSGRNRITSGFRLPDRPGHNGLDIVGEDSRDIRCPADGVVMSSAIITDRSNLTWEWGNYVRVDDAKGNRLYFCHMESRAVKAGQRVRAGDKLGVMGNTGYSFGAHTHFEVRKADNRTRMDPAAYLGIPNAKGTYTEGKTGWVQASSAWYWYEDGEPVRDAWRKENGWWYRLGADGKMLTGMQSIGGKWYCLNRETKCGVPKGACIITDGNGAII